LEHRRALPQVWILVWYEFSSHVHPPHKFSKSFIVDDFALQNAIFQILHNSQGLATVARVVN
jgi:hypothetical protein